MTQITASDQMGGLVMRRCAREYGGNSDSGGDARVRRHSRIHRCRCSVSMKRAGFHVMGPWSGSLGGVVRIGGLARGLLWSSGIVYIPSDRLYVHTIPIYGCMDRCSCYIQQDLTIKNSVVSATNPSQKKSHATNMLGYTGSKICWGFMMHPQ